MTRFLLTLLVLSSLLPITQQGGCSFRGKPKSRIQSLGNRPPIIKSLIPSSSTITVPCPRWVAGAYSVNSLTLAVETEAFDPDGDSLKYQYFVTGGKIVGEGAKVNWNLTGIDPGSYEVKVRVDDQRGGSASKTTSVSVLSNVHCPLPCANVTVSCPNDVEQNKSVRFTATISGGEPTVEPTYKWTVSAGTIINGQGTHNIEVDITGLADQQVTATLEVGGYPPECLSKASCGVQVRKKQ